MVDKLKELFEGSIIIIIMLLHFGNIPLAYIYGDKADVVISIFVPFYGFIVMLGEVL